MPSSILKQKHPPSKLSGRRLLHERRGILTGVSSQFTPGGRYEVSATYPDGSPYHLAYSAGIVTGNGSAPWRWPCAGDPPGTYSTSLGDLSTGRDTGSAGIRGSSKLGCGSVSPGFRAWRFFFGSTAPPRRQEKRGSKSALGQVFQADIATMERSDLPRDGQSQPRPFLSSVRPLQGKELLEHFLLGVRWNSRACILDAETNVWAGSLAA